MLQKFEWNPDYPVLSFVSLVIDYPQSTRLKIKNYLNIINVWMESQTALTSFLWYSAIYLLRIMCCFFHFI